MSDTKRNRQSFDRKKCISNAIISKTEDFYDKEGYRFYEKDRQDETDFAVTKEIEDALVDSAIYMSELVDSAQYSLRDLELMTSVSAPVIHRVVKTGREAKNGIKSDTRRFIPWTNGEATASDVFGKSCSEFYMGEQDDVILLRRFVPILETLRSATKQERDKYLGIIKEELGKARRENVAQLRRPNTERRTLMMAEKIEDLAGDYYASRFSPTSCTTKAGRISLGKIFRYADNIRDGGESPKSTAPVSINSVMRTAVAVDEPIDFLISDRYLDYLSAVYCDRKGEYRKVPEKEMDWLTDAVALGREACVSFCSSVLAQILKSKKS